MEQYIDQELTLMEFCKQNKIAKHLLHQLKRHFQNHQYPTLILNNLIEIINHRKHLACIEAPKGSGRTFSCLLILLDLFLKGIAEKNEEEPYYLLIVSATRDGTLQLKQITEQLIENIQPEIETIDLNQQFPMNKKIEQCIVSLPPITQPTILFANYHTIEKLKLSNKVDQKYFQFVLFDDCNLATVYGAKYQLEVASKWISKNQFTVYIGDESLIETLIGKAITVAKIEDEEEESNQKKQEMQIEQGNTFYYFLYQDLVQQQIVIYITLKLQLMQGKSLIIVQNLYELYYLQLLFQRCLIERFQIYNHENPKSLKYYTLATFNTGVIQILIATPQIFVDLENEFFERTKQKGQKTSQSYSLKKLDNLILYNLCPQELPKSLIQSVSHTICIVQNNEQNGEMLSQYITKEHQSSKEYPIKLQEIEAFRYRIEDTTKNISKYQVKMAEQIDFKKKLIKSPDLIEYFTQNQKEKELLQDQIIQLKKKLNMNAIQLPPGPVPEYLLPEIIKKQRKLQGEQSKVRVLVKVHDQDKTKQIQKRRILNEEMNNNMLPEDEEHNDKQRKPDHQYVTINQEEEDPEQMDASRLRPLSGKKIWKMKHGFKLKKRNKRLERKGVFTT